MSKSSILYASAILFGTFISSIVQVVLKKESIKERKHVLEEYLNIPVVLSYTVFVLTTLLSVFAYRGIPLSAGPVLEATSYFYVTFFGVKIFHESLSWKKIIALLFIVVGIVVYSCFG